MINNREDSRVMMKIVCALISRPESAIFRKPVAWKKLGLDDYPDIVKNPMDLGTIKRNLEKGDYYKNYQDVANDIRKVWLNCMAYNQDGSEIYHLADIFSRKFEEAYSSIRTSKEEDYERVPTIDERIAFSYEVFRLPSAELGYILTIIEDKCQEALSKRKGSDDILINVDYLCQKPAIFHEVVDVIKNSKQGVKGAGSGSGSKRERDRGMG